MKIQISEAMRINLERQNSNEYKLERRGEIDVYVSSDNLNHSLY